MPKGFKKEIARLAQEQGTVSVDDVILQRAIADEQKKDITNNNVKQNGADEPGTVPTTVNLEQLQQLAQNAAVTAVSQVTAQFEKEKEQLIKEKDDAVNLAKEKEIEAAKKTEESQQLAKDAVDLATKQAQEKIDAAKAESDKAIALANAKVEEAKKERETIEGLFKLSGIEMPNFNATTNPLNQEPQGMARDLVGLIQDPTVTQRHNLQDPRTQLYLEQKDFKAAQNFAAIHFGECAAKGVNWKNSPLIKDLEKYFKANGFLSGRMPTTNAAGPTIGTPGSLGDIFLDVVSVILRQTHNAANIWWQFTTTVYNAASAPSQNILVGRWANLADPVDIADFELATPTTYSAVQGAIGTLDDSQALEVTTVPITIAQYGLGKANTVGTRPVFIPEFHNQISLISLIEAVGTRLMQNYFSFEELLIRREFEKATTVLYNSSGDVVYTPAEVEAGDSGQFTEAFANSVYTELFVNKVPTFPDGCYGLALNGYAANQFKSSLGEQYAPVTPEQKMAITNTFTEVNGLEIGHSNGYMGTYCGFHVFRGNSFGVGAPGSSPTVNTVTFGGSTETAVDSFAFGPGCVGRGVALGAEVRASGMNPYNLGESYIWVSREGVGLLDLDATIPDASGALNQQTRCFKLRTSKKEI